MTLPISFKEFAKDTVKALLFLTIMHYPIFILTIPSSLFT